MDSVLRVHTESRCWRYDVGQGSTSVVHMQYSYTFISFDLFSVYILRQQASFNFFNRYVVFINRYPLAFLTRTS